MADASAATQVDPAAAGANDPWSNLYINDMTSNCSGPRQPPRHLTLARMQSEEFEASEFGPEIPSDSFRWVHVPVNDVEILKTCVAKIAPDGADSLHKACVEKIRPTSAIPPNIIPDHAWSMEASFEAHVIESAGTQHPFTLFLQYSDWDTFENMKRAKSSQTTITPRLKHPRKTLDQFFYTGLNNTETRDAGQTISKWTSKSSKMTAKGMETAEDDSHIIMVDQLWICAVNHNTLISCFPSVLSPSGDPTMPSGRLMDSTHFDLRKCHDLSDLTAMLVASAVNNVFASDQPDLVGIYRWAIGIKAATHTEMLEEFSKRQASKTTELIAAAGLTELNLALEIADILDELNMLLLLLEKQKTVLIALEEHFQKLKPLEVKTDNGKPKLHITQSNFDRLAIRNESSSGGEIHVVDVFAKNMDVLLENKVGNAFLATRIDGEAGVQMSQAMRRLQTETANIKRLRGEAKQAHKMVIELLDLEQKAASLLEARAATEQTSSANKTAKAAITQGKAVIVFTVFTVVFLPLSFFATYFGQNVSEFTGDKKNPSSGKLWRIAGPASVGIIVLAVVAAFLIMRIKTRKSEQNKGDVEASTSSAN